MPHRPSILKRVILVFAFLPVMALAQIAVRNYVTVSDQSDGSPRVPNMQWHQAETVQWDIFVQWRDDPNTSIPTNANPVWQAWLTNDLSTLYIQITGTVVDAASGQVRVSLTSAEANMATNTYESAVSVWLGTTNMGTIARNQALVKHSPNTTNVTYVGTSGFPWYAVSGDTLEGNMDGGGNTISNATFVGDGSSLTGIAASAGNWWTSAPSTEITFPTNAHTANYLIKSPDKTNWVWAADNTASAGNPLDSRTATNDVNMGAKVLTNTDSLYLGSNAFNYIPQAPLIVRGRGWTGGALTTNIIDTGLFTGDGTQYSVVISAGEDGGFSAVSEYEGGHGSFFTLINQASNSTDFGHGAIFLLGQTNTTGLGAFGITLKSDVNAFGTSYGNFPFVITPNLITTIGGTGVGGGGSIGLEVYGGLTNFSIGSDILSPSQDGGHITGTEPWMSGSFDTRLQVSGNDAGLAITSQDAGTTGSRIVLRDITTNGVYNNDWYFLRFANSAAGTSNRLYIGHALTNNPSDVITDANLVLRPDPITEFNGNTSFGNTLGEKVWLFENGAIIYGLGIQNNLMQFYTDDATGDIAFGYGESTNFTRAMTINNSVPGVRVGPGTGAPATALEVEGTITATGFAGDGSSLTGVLLTDGTVAMTGDINTGGNSVTNLPTPTGATEAAHKAYVDAQVLTPPTNTSVYGINYIHDGAVSVTLSTQDVYVAITGWTQGESSGMVIDQTNITIQSAGTYLLAQQISSTSSVNNAVLETTFFTNGVHQNEGEFRRKLSTGGDVGSASGFAILTLASGDEVSLRMKRTSGVSATVTLIQAQFGVHMLSSFTGGGGDWWTNAPDSAITVATNSHTADYILSSPDGTNFQWVANAAAGGDPVDGRAVTNTIDLAGNILTNGTTIAGTNFVIGTGGSLTGTDTMTLAVSQLVAEVISPASGSDLTIGPTSSNVIVSANVTMSSNLTVNSNLEIDATAGIVDSAGGQYFDYSGTVGGGTLTVNIGDIVGSNNGTDILISDATSVITIGNTAGNVDLDVLGHIDESIGGTADAGFIRLDNAGIIAWEASPAGTDVTLTVDTSEVLILAGASDVTLPADSISDTELDEGATFTWTGGHTFDNNVTISSNLTVQGNIDGEVTVLDKSAAYTATTNDTLGTIIFCDVASTQTLHDVTAAERHISYYTIGDVLTVITANSNDYIRLDGTNTVAGGSITNNETSGDMVTLISRNATNWVVIGRSGTWTK